MNNESIPLFANLPILGKTQFHFFIEIVSIFIMNELREGR